MSYRFISSTGEVIRTKTLREFSDKYSINIGSVRALSCGSRARIKGFCSTSPKVKALRQRFTLTLVNTHTGNTEIIGQSVSAFAERHGLCMNELSKLVNGHKVMYRGWCLQQTVNAINGPVADKYF